MQCVTERIGATDTHLAAMAIKDAVYGRACVLKVRDNVEPVLHVIPAALDGIHPHVVLVKLPSGVGDGKVNTLCTTREAHLSYHVHPAAVSLGWVCLL